MKTIEAIYENGVFRPVEELPETIRDGQIVQLTVETESSQELLALAAQVYEGLSGEEVDEVERIALDRRDFFGASER